MNQEEKREVVQIHLDDIIPNRFQPREIFNENALKELALSIKEHGVIQPIIVRSVNGKYEIIAGERRYKASALAGLTKIPAIIRDMDDKEASKVALLENLQRKNLNPIEEARTYQKILELDQMTQEELAKTMGKSQSSVANKLRLLQLSDSVQDALLKEEISERHARTLLKLEDPNEQKDMVQKVINEKMSVRLLEEEIDKMHPNNKDEIKEESTNVKIDDKEDGKVFVPDEPKEEGIGNFINTSPLKPTTEIKNPDEELGKIKIISPDGTPTGDNIINYGEVDKEKDEEEEKDLMNPVEPINIDDIKDKAEDISTGFGDKSSSSLDNLLNINNPQIPKSEEPKDDKFITAGEAIVKNEEEDTNDTKNKDYFNTTDLININLPSEVNTDANSNTTVSDAINSINSEDKSVTEVEAKRKIREVVEELQAKGIKISIDEMDFEKNIQIMIKIEK